MLPEVGTNSNNNEELDRIETGILCTDEGAYLETSSSILSHKRQVGAERTKSLFSIVALKSLIAHMVSTWSEWISGPQCYLGLRGLLSSSVLLFVLFIVRLCWLMAQRYVRREERLPQAQAGHTVNPSAQPLTDWVLLQDTQAHIRDSLPTVFSLVLLGPQYTPHLVGLPDLFSSRLPKSLRHAVCVCVCGLNSTSVVPLSRYHSSCLFSMCSACAPCWFYPFAAVWWSRGEHFFSSVNSLSLIFNLYTHTAWAIRHASVCFSTLS